MESKNFQKEITDVEIFSALFDRKIDTSNFRLIMTLYYDIPVEIPWKKGEFFTTEQIEEIKKMVLTPEVVENVGPSERIEFINIVQKELKEKIDACSSAEEIDAVKAENEIILNGIVKFVKHIANMRNEIFIHKSIISNLATELKDEVGNVVISKQLIKEPARLINFSDTKVSESSFREDRVLAINPNHDIFKAIKELHVKNMDYRKYAKLLYDLALLVEGARLNDVEKFIDLMCELLQKETKS